MISPLYPPPPVAKSPQGRILWLAVAEARGHLMRAQLLRNLLAPHGVTLDILTTSEAGAAFLQALGTPAQVLPGRYLLVYDADQNLQRRATEIGILRYLLESDGYRRDVQFMMELAANADLIVNDIHPALLLAPLFPSLSTLPIVQLYGEHIWSTLAAHLDGRGPVLLGQSYRALLELSQRRSLACIEHTPRATALSRQPGQPLRFQVPPLIAAPKRTPAQVRSQLAVAPDQKLVAIYLNPYFRDPALITALQAALSGCRIYGVSEAFADHPSFRAYDPNLADVVAAADLFISAPGMAGLTQARHFGTPFLGLLTDQPEQARNVAFLHSHQAPWQVLRLAEVCAQPALLAQTALGLLAAPRSAHASSAERLSEVQGCWTALMLELLAHLTL